MRCGECGREADADANFCESCGSALKAGSRSPQLKHGPQKKNAKTERPAKAKKKFSFEPWQLITGGIVLSLVAFFTYSELTREPPSRNLAPQQENFQAPTAGMLQEIEQLQNTVDANPKDAASLIRLANMLHDVGMHNQMFLNRAINAYSKYLKLKPTDPNARVDMGICYFEMARVDTNSAASWMTRSIQEMEAAFKSNPDHQPAAFNLGIVNLNAGNPEESAKWFHKTMEINPTSELGKKAEQMLQQHSSQGPPTSPSNN